MMCGSDILRAGGINRKVDTMRILWLLPIGAVLALGACSNTAKTAEDSTTSQSGVLTLQSETVEVGCGMCVYGMAGAKGCKLYADVNGKTIPVSGADVDLHAHNLCSVSKEALVSGQIEGDTLVVTSIELN